MEIINIFEPYKFSRRHPKSRKALSRWIDVASEAEWSNFVQLRETFVSADYLEDLVIFDIDGNNYRLVTSIDYDLKDIYVLDIMTHARYSRWRP